MIARSISTACALLFTLAACESDPGGEGHFRAQASQGSGHHADIYPDEEWALGDPEAHGLSSEGLEALVDVAEAWNTSCLVVIHDGVLVGEWYWDGFDRHTDVVNAFSTTKSVTSMLVGIAEAEGALRAHDRASDYIPAWAGTASAKVRIRNLLANDSGRFWSFESDYFEGLMAAESQTAYGIGLEQQHPIGSFWEYNNSAIQTLEAVLAEATGEDLDAFAQSRLFEPIGATANLTRDLAGNPLTYQGIQASCDDLARIGYLALREGRWQGQQVVPKRWMKQSTKPSSKLNAAYGYLWWLNRKGTIVEPTFLGRTEYEGRLIPGADDDVFAAVGAFGQLVIVDPDDEYVVVRLQNVPDIDLGLSLSPDPTGFSQLREITAAFEAAKL
jgi:CubicO group peptidase (beta-lactamase class C family)